ncbi:MAG: 3-deoxy-7-phosphoheptulonate synthase [Symbiobacteriia bacterium]
MIIVMSPRASQDDIAAVLRHVEEVGLQTHLSEGEAHTIIGCIGDVSSLDHDGLQNMVNVESVVRVSHPFKLASRDFHPESSQVDVAGITFGGRAIPVIAGPCSVESYDMLLATARSVRASGASALRGGAYKPRSSPYSFQGMGREGLQLLAEARRQTGMPVFTEAMSPDQIEQVAEYADVIQIGARNMQNYPLLREAGQSGKPVLLKRGLSATVEEWLLAAEYILAQGNLNVMLCERGIRTFETATRNTLDLNAVPVIKKLSHLPVLVDPSHGTGYWDLVTPMARAAVAAGADGLILEVHPDPAHATSDGGQSLKFPVFHELMQQVEQVARALDRSLHAPLPLPASQGVEDRGAART